MLSLTRTQKRNRKKKAERHRRKASETRRRQASASRKIQAAARRVSAVREYNKLDKCGICLDKIRPSLEEQCHNFHPKCIAQWRASTNANRHLCPMCRNPMISNPTARTELAVLARNIRSKLDELTLLIDHISYLEPDYFGDVPELHHVLQGVMIDSNVILARVADGELRHVAPDARSEQANDYLRRGDSHLNQMDDLIYRLLEDLEGLQEVADIRATH